MKILVTGSSGRIGGAIAARLTLRHQVTGLDLRAGPLTSEIADVEDTARLESLLPGTDAVVHTASLHVPDLAARSREEFRAVNVDATRRLLQAAGAAGVGRFIYTSTTSLYGDAMLPANGVAAWVDESLPPQPRDVYDETKLAAEEACRDAARAGLACTSLRMSRCFPEEPRLVAIYRLFRGVDADDVAQAHELALAAQAADSRSSTCRRRHRSGATTAGGCSRTRPRSCWSAFPGRRRSSRAATGSCHVPSTAFMLSTRRWQRSATGRSMISPRCSGARRPDGHAGGSNMSSVGYHEPVGEMSDATRDMHRAIVSLMEELEAIDWYQQRADACKDPELRAILEHNRDEEKEHAAMVLEWIRRRDAVLSKELKDYLFTSKPIRDDHGHD